MCNKIDDKLRVAYALNLCMVSVSQIIDYDDVNILEQEYDAILNNLNLEMMPKDEALLHILKQLLDTITFFRIQEGDKKMIEKEYQQRMRNAIWSAVPNFAVIGMGGTPLTMAVSLATQVGIGYMNYRKEKAQISLEQEKEKWKLQRSAMEQFNGLRRELFDTAWRLADKYNFPDAYRLTERQITRYNAILMDSDYLRRYERLEYIADKFEAYPPFWYALGNAANTIAQNTENGSEVCSKYRSLAIQHFEKFLGITERNLLREDKLLSSCALEYAELLIEMGRGDTDREKIDGLIERAISSAGSDYDVLELCSINYMRLGNYEKSAKLLRMLVNEEYNEVLNAQLLSQIYVSRYIDHPTPIIKYDYTTLEKRVPAGCLFPLPEKLEISDSENDELQKIFIRKQRTILLDQYAFVLDQLITKYQEKFDDSLKKRELDGLLATLSKFSNAIQAIPGISDTTPIIDAIGDNIRNRRSNLRCLKDSNDISVLNFPAFVKAGLKDAAKQIRTAILELENMVEISKIQGELFAFCLAQECPYPELTSTTEASFDVNESGEAEKSLFCAEDYLGETAEKEQEKQRKMLQCIKDTENESQLIQKDFFTGFYSHGTRHFWAYYNRHWRELIGGKNDILAIINDTSPVDEDWIFTVNGIQCFKRALIPVKKYLSETFPYEGVKRRAVGKKIKLDIDGSGLVVLDNESLNLENIFDLIQKLGNISKQYVKNEPKNELGKIVAGWIKE